ncbi:MAG: hypothetical protein M5U09_27540 [Gammaproteobacteria bacterium]|nr:hypothetical protein [Gammaproteobacteria bacterium]
MHAFLLAFTRQDEAVLLVKTTPYGEAEGYQGRSSRELFDAIVASHRNRARVEYVSSELDDDIARLHLAGDAYVSLSRGEGVRLGAFDAACAGTPVIATGWSGHLDFLPADSACLVDYRLGRVGAHLFHHPPQEQYWALADLDHAIDWMRRLYRGQGRRGGARASSQGIRPGPLQCRVHHPQPAGRPRWLRSRVASTSYSASGPKPRRSTSRSTFAWNPAAGSTGRRRCTCTTTTSRTANGGSASGPTSPCIASSRSPSSPIIRPTGDTGKARSSRTPGWTTLTSPTSCGSRFLPNTAASTRTSIPCSSGRCPTRCSNTSSYLALKAR